MADLSITAANVAAGTDAVTMDGTAGATITAGQALYRDSTDSSKLKLADTNASAAAAACVGIALHGAASGQPIRYQTSGTISIGATTVKGYPYFVSATAGGIAPAADLASGHYTCLIGIATDTSGTIKMGLLVGGAAI